MAQTRGKRRRIYRYTGDVVRESVAKGSKSARRAVLLETPRLRLVLRRHRGNPFRDRELERLVGERIDCRGYRSGDQLILTQWAVVSAEDELE